MITFAQRQMIPELKNIWSECFGDPQRYIDFYFANRFEEEETLVWLEEDGLAAMLTLLPAEVMIGGAYHISHYIYAVATRKEFRGRGISTKLLRHANDLLMARKEPNTMLVPAEEGLFDFYRARGYVPSFSIRRLEQPAEESGIVFSFSPSSPREYKRIRDGHFKGEGYVQWDERAITYAIRENSFLGGVACTIASPGRKDVALCLKQEDTLLVRETTLSDDLLSAALSAIAKKMGCTQISARLWPKSTLGQLCPMGLANRAHGVVGGYLNLVLD